MGEPAFACYYFVFAIMFATVNVIVQDVTVRNQMFSAVVDKYLSMPYRVRPSKYKEDVSVPLELYTWMRHTFVPVTFAEAPKRGDADGFCTSGHPCYIDEGDCDLDSHCSTGLTCGDKGTLTAGVMVNGNYWDVEELQAYCSWKGTPVDTSLDAGAVPPELQACTTTPSITGTTAPCCWDDASNSYITEIYKANDAALEHETVNFIGRGNCPTSVSAGGDCCAKTTVDPLTVNETEHIEAAQGDNRPVTVGNFNRVLMVRLSVKRYKKVGVPGDNSPAFADLTPFVLSGGGGSLDPTIDNGKKEDKESFTGTPVPYAKQYEWRGNDSYAGSGAYVEWINPAQGASHMGMVLERMYLDGFFDNRLGTFTVDMLTYNGNSETFMHIAFSFVFDPSGSCIKTTEVMYSNLKGLKGSSTVAKMIEWFFLIPSVIFFLLWEIKKGSDRSWLTHLSSANAWVDLFFVNAVYIRTDHELHYSVQ
jgi:hypothetical protein